MKPQKACPRLFAVPLKEYEAESRLGDALEPVPFRASRMLLEAVAIIETEKPTDAIKLSGVELGYVDTEVKLFNPIKTKEN